MIHTSDQMKRIELMGQDIMTEAYLNTKILGFKRMSRFELMKKFSRLTGRSLFYSARHILLLSKSDLLSLQLAIVYREAKEWAIKHT